MSFSRICGQTRSIDQLQQAFSSGKMAHAYLFVGPDGVGKRTTAHAFAKMLLCHNRQTTTDREQIIADSCGACSSCKLFEAGTHPDFKPIYKELVKFTREGKNKTTPVEMPVDVIREFLIEVVAGKPTESKHVVYIIDEAEKVNKSSQNAILKILEEPPSFCMIILLCSRLEKMLPTTQSRCQRVAFGPVPEDFIIHTLTEQGIAPQEALYWARFSEGSVGTALSWATLRPEKGPTAYEIKRELMDRICTFQLADAVDLAAWMGQSSSKISAGWVQAQAEVSKTDLTRRAQKGLIQMIQSLLADVMGSEIHKAGELVNSDQVQAVQRAAQHLTSSQVAEKIMQTHQMIRWIDSSVNEKLIFEHLLLNLSISDILSILSVS